MVKHAHAGIEPSLPSVVYLKGKIMDNLITNLHEEICRNKDLLKEYEKTGTAGVVIAIITRRDIAAAEEALSNGDTVAMLQALRTLKESKK